MGYVLLWLEVLAAALLVAALMVVRSARIWHTRPIRAHAWLLATLLPTAAIAAATGAAWFGARLTHIPTTALIPGLVVVPLVFLGTAALCWCGLWAKRRLAAAAWSARRLAEAMITSVALLVVTFVVLDFVALKRLAALRAEAGAMSRSVAPERVPEGDNAAVLYAQANELLPAVWPDAYNDWNDAKREADDPTTVPYPADELRALIEEHGATLDVLRLAAARPGCYFHHNYARPGFDMEMPELRELRDGARLVELSARDQAAQGRYAEALADAATMFAIADHASAEAGIVPLLTAQAIQGMAIDTLEAVLTGTALPQDVLSGVRPHVGFSAQRQVGRAMTMEEATGLAEFSKLADCVSVFTWLNGLAGGSGTNAIERLLPSASFYRVFALDTDIATYRGMYGQLQQACDRPIYEVDPTFVRINTQSRDEPTGLGTQLLLPATTVIFEAAARSDAIRAAAQAGLAMHRYRAAHGAFPASLDELVPEVLDAVPLDPFDGQAIRLVTTDDGWIVYSIGPDFNDDQARTRYNYETRTGDLLFRYRRPGASEAGGARNSDATEGAGR